MLKKSTDSGASWGPISLVHGESKNTSAGSRAWVTIGNPAPVAVDTVPGKVVLVGCRNNVQAFVMSSLDFGTTWSPARYLTSANPKSDSWPWLATGPPQGLQLPTGRLLVASDHRGANHADVFSHAMFSDDLGETWQLSSNITGGNECQAAPLPNGTAGHPDGTVVMCV